MDEIKPEITPLGDEHVEKPTEDLKPLEPAKLGVRKRVRPLSLKALTFLELILAGYPPPEAHKMAGFTGSAAAAYQLKVDLREHLTAMLEERGLGRTDLKLELKKLLDIPLNDVDKKGVGLRDKLKLLQFWDKLTEKQAAKDEASKPTPFILIEEPKSVTIHENGKPKEPGE